MNQNVNTTLYAGNNFMTTIPDTQYRMHKCPYCNNVIKITNTISGNVPLSSDEYANSGGASANSQFNKYKCPKCFNVIKINNSISHNVPINAIYNNTLHSNTQSSIYKCPNCVHPIILTSTLESDVYSSPIGPNFISSPDAFRAADISTSPIRSDISINPCSFSYISKALPLNPSWDSSNTTYSARQLKGSMDTFNF